jgi:hypothetical protein
MVYYTFYVMRMVKKKIEIHSSSTKSNLKDEMKCWHTAFWGTQGKARFLDGCQELGSTYDAKTLKCYILLDSEFHFQKLY